MGFWIVVDGFNKKNDLPDDLADRFYGRLTKNYCKDNTGNDSFTVTLRAAFEKCSAWHLKNAAWVSPRRGDSGTISGKLS